MLLLKTTKLTFDTGRDRHMVLLRHPEFVTVTMEYQEDPSLRVEHEGNLILSPMFIIVRFQRTANIQLNDIHYPYPRDVRRIENGSMVELWFRGETFFAWDAWDLQSTGLWTINERVLPNQEDGGRFAPYINAHGLRQWSYNLLCLLLDAWFRHCHARRKGSQSA